MWAGQGIDQTQARQEAELVGSPDVRTSVNATHTFNELGTYFPRLIAYSEREGETDEIVTQVENRDSVRVVVSP